MKTIVTKLTIRLFLTFSLLCIYMVACKSDSDPGAYSNTLLVPGGNQELAGSILAKIADEDIWLKTAIKARLIRFKPVVSSGGVTAKHKNVQPQNRQELLTVLKDVTYDPEAFLGHLERSSAMWKQYITVSGLKGDDEVLFKQKAAKAVAKVSSITTEKLVAIEKERLSKPSASLRPCLYCSFSGPQGVPYYGSPTDTSPYSVEPASGGGEGDGDQDDSMRAMGACSATFNVGQTYCSENKGLETLMALLRLGKSANFPAYLDDIAEAGAHYNICFDAQINTFDACAAGVGFYKRG